MRDGIAANHVGGCLEETIDSGATRVRTLDRLEKAGFLAAGISQPQTGYWNYTDTKNLREITPMKHEFKAGDHVEWNSEAGQVRGTIKKKVTSVIKFKTYTVHASKEEPQYLIKSDKTDHLAMHKGAALTKISTNTRSPQKGSNPKKQCRAVSSSKCNG